MRFDKLTIENFSSFYGKHELIFNNSPEKPIVIIVGGSGKGKTSIFDALNWALYGLQYEPILEKESQKNIIDYANQTAVQDAVKSNSSMEMTCSLFFNHEGRQYRIQQALCIKNQNGKLQILDRTSTLYEHNSSGNAIEIPHVDSFLNEILPSNVRDYFLFNGDRINRLAMPGSSMEIRDGIYRVVDLELLQNGVTHLLEIAKKFRKIAKESSIGEVANIETRYTNAYEELESYKNKYKTSSDEKRALEDNIEIISQKLRGMDKVKDLQSKRDQLKQNISILSNTLRQSIIDMRAVSATAIGKFAIPEIDLLIKELEEKRKKGEIPSSISQNLLRDILDMKECICGTEFTKGDKTFEHLAQRLESEKEKDKTGQDLIDLYFDLTTAKSEILKSISRLKELEMQLKDILGKLIDAPEEQISKLASKLQEYSSNLTNIALNLQTYQSKISEKDDLIKKIQQEREEIGNKQDRVRKHQLRDNLAQQSAEELMRIFDQFAEDSRIEVQNLTSKEFKFFIPTAESLTVGIDAEFHYDIRDENGNSALQQLSQGQKQALSLAYITSIAKVSEKNPPLVIDYPLGRLDEDVQDNIVRRLPELSSQTILLVLPGTEWNEHNKAILRPKASDIYSLEFDKIMRQSTIVKDH